MDAPLPAAPIEEDADPRISARSARRILKIGLPIVGGMVSQNVLDIVDTLMVGQLGKAALAAVGIASFVNFMAVAVLIGLSAGVQAVVARRKGEGRESELAIPLNGGLFVAVLAGVPISVAGVMLAPSFYPALVNGEATVIAEGTPYLQARLAGVVVIALNFSFRGYWYGIGETGTYLRIIVTVHIVNIVLSYVLIFGAFGFEGLGTLGAGLGTTLALTVGTVLYAVTTYRRARGNGFLTRLPRGATMASLMRLSIPSAIQTLVYAAGLTTLFVIAGWVGVTALAVANVLINLTKLAVLPAMGLGFASMTLVSEALGRGAAQEASAWAFRTAQLALVVVLAVAVCLFAFPQTIFSAFTDNAEVIEQGRVALRVAGFTLFVEAMAAVMANSLIGAGAARITMAVTLSTQWLIGLPLAAALALWADWGIVGVWLGWSTFRLISAVALTAIWIDGRWKAIKL